MKHTFPGLPLEHYSYSSIKTWYQCPSKWMRKYLYDQPDTPSYESWVGIFVHQVLENVINPETPAAGRTLPVLRKEATRLWTEETWPIPSSLVPDFKLKVWSALSRLEQVDDPKKASVVATELEVRVTLPWLGEHVPFLGYIDRVDETSEGLVLVDYKTGRRPLARPWQESALQQLMIYAGAMKYLKPKLGTPVEARLIYLGSNDILASPIRGPLMDKAKAWWMDGYWAIQPWITKGHRLIEDRTLDDLACASHLCGWCPYEQDCPTGRDRSSRHRSPQHQLRR